MKSPFDFLPDCQCQCVSGGGSQKFLGLEWPAMTGMRWPQGIAKSNRVKLDTAHGSFCLHRQLVNEMFHRQSIHLTGNLLIMAATGSVVLERGEDREVVEEGDTALILPGDIVITEVPGRGCTHSDIYYAFFNTRVLRDALLQQPRVEQIALRLQAWPRELEGMPRSLNRVLEGLRHKGKSFPYHLSTTLLSLTNQGFGQMFSFLARAYFIPKLKLNLFMEQRVLAGGPREVDAAGDLARQLRLHQGVAPEEWLRKRRSELDRLWVAHGATDRHEIARRFGDEFKQHCRAKRATPSEPRIPWQNLDATQRRSISAPFWLRPSEPFVAAPEHPHESVQAEAEFWNATSTIG